MIHLVGVLFLMVDLGSICLASVVVFMVDYAGAVVFMVDLV